MKTLVFSDTHLTDKFEPKKFELLKKIITEADKVIINGDFWDYYNIKFESFINSEWKQLFPLLKSKQAIYIPGNHDKLEWMDSTYNLFAEKVVSETEVKAGDTVLKIIHGDTITHSTHPDIQFDGTGGPIVKLNDLLQFFMIKIFKGIIYGKFLDNTVMKRWAVTNLKKNEILVAGHSHWAEFNLNKKFINLGFMRFGIASYLLVDDDKFNLIKTSY